MQFVEHEMKETENGNVFLDEKNRCVCTCGIHLKLEEFQLHAVKAHEAQIQAAMNANNNFER